MRPENTRVWRKTRRAERRGTERGRRSTHEPQTEPPRRGSTWLRRHPGPDNLTYWQENAR